MEQASKDAAGWIEGKGVSAKVRGNRGQMGKSFYGRSPEVVARELLGKVVRHNYKGEWLTGRIVEVEAYLGTG